MNSSTKKLVENAGWYSYKETNTVVVFIHGFLSDSGKCWKSSNGKYWPEILSNDSIFEAPSVYLGEYHTSIDSGGYDIAQCTAELRDSLELKVPGKNAPLDFNNILFICHSLGGIICRRLLEESSSKFSGKTIGIVLIASPSAGSAYADEFSGLAKIYGNQVAKQLKTDGEILKDIDNRFKNLIIRNPFNKLVGAEICEQHGPIRFKFLPFRMKPIVEVNSASRYFGQARMIPETDHSSIVKPSSPDHKTHKFLQLFYQESFKPIKIEVKGSAPQVVNIFAKPDPLFEVYSKPHREFYVGRDLDASLLEKLKVRSVWVFGSSGVGKTSIAKRAIEQLSVRTTEIHLGHIEEHSVKEQLLIEIICALNPDEATDGNNLHQRAIQLIKDRSRETIIPIFLDEVPISTSSTNSIVAQTIGNILDAVKQTQAESVNFLICSIVCPPITAISQKMHERINFVEAKPWLKENIETLFDLIAFQLGLKDQMTDIRDAVVVGSAGLPRFVKSFFRNLTREDALPLNIPLALFRANQEAGT